MTFDKADFLEAVRLWTEWNAKINVVSRKDIDNLFEHHIMHSLAIAEYLWRTGRFPGKGVTVLDVGTGGGFPGIPLAMVMPEVKCTLCDSRGKKVKVAQAVSEGLGLGNVECVNARAEALPGSFDWVVSRAVTTLDNFYPWVRGKFRRGILYLKGGDIEAEISDLCCKCRVSRGDVRAWPVADWIEDEYFEEKFVIEIGKDYLCPPKSNN